MNQKKEECLKNASNRINSLSSSKSHSSINAGTGNKNKQCNNGQTGEDYYKTHSLTSIPNERSLDHVMNHTNLLYSSANSKRLKKPINDKKNGINSIDHVDSPEEKLDHKNQYSKGGNLNEGKVEQVRSEISTVHNSVAVSNGKKEMTTSLKQNSSHVPFNNFHYNRNYQCRHSRKTFSEQCTQTDPKSSTTIEDEERTQNSRKTTKTKNNTTPSQSLNNSCEKEEFLDHGFQHNLKYWSHFLFLGIKIHNFQNTVQSICDSSSSRQISKLQKKVVLIRLLKMILNQPFFSILYLITYLNISHHDYY